jgi:ElaB/YqjD/DUF883 family membrane-anchored ribosome-binding protein
MRSSWTAWRTGGLLALGACVVLPIAACRAGYDAVIPAPEPAAEGVRAASRKGADLKRSFEAKAAEARNDLDEARRSVELVLSSHDTPGSRQTQAAREAARRALKRGEDVLGRAAEDGSRTAETWARVVQDRMMRLEETLKRFTGATGHADS